MEPDQIKLQTPQFDARFPNQNQTKNCWQNYVDFHKCRKAKGEDYEPCNFFFRAYKSLCPKAWVSVYYWRHVHGGNYSHIGKLCTLPLEARSRIEYSILFRISNWE